MSDEQEIRAAAQKYVNDQIAIMEKYGHAPRLSAEKYGELVQKMIDLTKMLRAKYRQSQTARVDPLEGK